VQPFRHPREDWALLSAYGIADSDDVGEELATFENVENVLCLLVRDVDSYLSHGFYRQQIKRSGLKASTLSLEVIAAGVVEPSLGHLAPGTVMDADEKDFCFHWELRISKRNQPESYDYVTIFATVQTSRRYSAKSVDFAVMLKDYVAEPRVRFHSIVTASHGDVTDC
jgi:hypothetical protein